ncbi:MAG TPA: glycosyltransferase family 2 protein [Spirochaetota bacterium]|nr:glycosyltransferase family 2 protein [Spirochaetota bacterium]HRZ26059.1 glycosyltransferase family 2 protein [Spirochaetota bacterium]HSA15730.1 glycosyltransferase family 2 protein [Spirochaetota bacterium]
MKKSIDKSRGRFVFVIPVYNHEGKIADVIKAARGVGLPVIVVNDGSTDSTPQILKGTKGITVLTHGENRGKGAAIRTGLIEAAARGDWAVTIDADGQHDPRDAKALIAAIPEGKRPIVVGERVDMTGPDVPWTSSFGRKFSNFWVWVSGGPMLADTQSGFRIYPVPETLGLNVRADRFQFEVEVLAKAGWRGMDVVHAPVSVSYRPGMERVSHFRPFVDFMRNSSVFARLITQRIFIPHFIRKKM